MDVLRLLRFDSGVGGVVCCGGCQCGGACFRGCWYNFRFLPLEKIYKLKTQVFFSILFGLCAGILFKHSFGYIGSLEAILNIIAGFTYGNPEG